MEKEKKYRCLSGGYITWAKGEIYPCSMKSGIGVAGRTVECFAKKFPHHWELVEDVFELPEKWFVKYSNREEFVILMKWCNANWSWLEPKGNRGCNSNRRWVSLSTKVDNFEEISFDQFREYVLKEGDTNKEFLGYKVREEFVDYARALVDSLTTKEMWLEGKTTFAATNSDWGETFKQAGVLDLWFDKVYKEELNLPVINGYKGELNKDTRIITYGCAEFRLEALIEIHKNLDIGNNRSIQEITLDSGVALKASEICEIIEYCEQF